MASEQIALSELITIRDGLVTAYKAVMESPTKAYMLGDRQFTYEDRAQLRVEIQHWTHEILLRSTTFKAKGKNRMDFAKWG